MFCYAITILPTYVPALISVGTPSTVIAGAPPSGQENFGSLCKNNLVQVICTLDNPFGGTINFNDDTVIDCRSRGIIDLAQLLTVCLVVFGTRWKAWQR